MISNILYANLKSIKSKQAYKQSILIFFSQLVWIKHYIAPQLGGPGWHASSPRGRAIIGLLSSEGLDWGWSVNLRDIHHGFSPHESTLSCLDALGQGSYESPPQNEHLGRERQEAPERWLPWIHRCTLLQGRPLKSSEPNH